MKINKALNLVIPVELNGVECFVHSTPISYEVFEKYFWVMSRTFGVIESMPASHVSGPRIAAMMLKKQAEITGEWEGQDGVEKGLINEIRRLTNIVIPGSRGWELTPYYDAIQRGIISTEDAREIDGIVTYFILASAMHKRDLLKPTLELLSMWGARPESLDCSAFVNSLPTLTEAENFGGTATTLSVPI
jgi:hypothetical protein